MLELFIAVFLILLNGLFALSELSIVSARKSRLKAMTATGYRGAATALQLAEDPGRFLSTVQIGITLVGILAGAFSGAALGERLSTILLENGVPSTVAGPLGFGIVISIITYLSVVIGELVPKHLALSNPERIACVVAPGMLLLSRAGAPAVWLLNASTQLIFRLLGRTESENMVSEEEIRTLVAEAEASGVIEGGEREMISGVMRFADRSARGLMTTRKDVKWIDLSDTDEEIRETLMEARHSRLPVSQGGQETMIGVIQTRDVLGEVLRTGEIDIRAWLKDAPIVPDTMDATRVLEILRGAQVPILLVHDEYGHFEGVITPADVLEAIAGVFRADLDEEDEQYLVQREDGSWLVSGEMPIDEMADQLGVSIPKKRSYQTAAGLVIDLLGDLPKVGQVVETDAWRFEIVDMDGWRVDKILASKITSEG
ncbi:hemolysin family protein [Rhizobiaceae bacterium BDR2-2]|uniref:Hemolysin family protein n=1 Tax=Ectorhizobium quercum TaxID=2965071 RepID=A0AAE3SU25_9HYPH|nr:hemolysin family protein [Ectorhizobium quercum]MCX8996592.1 hemolysin family protein [Ectorhizobium quercum]